MLGNPVSKITGMSQDFAPFQIDYHNAIQQFHNVEILKSRKLGATEAANTSIALNCFDRYSGHDVLFVAGNELKISREVLYRFYELFSDKQHTDGQYAFKYLNPEYVEPLKKKEIDWKYAMDRAEKISENHIIKKTRWGNEPMIEFQDGTRAFAWAVVRQEKAQAFRGADDLICVFFTEAAHTGLKNDQPAMNALQPNLAQRDDGDFILESTGNGKRGFYYSNWIEIMKTLSKNFKITLKDDSHQILVDKLHELWKSGKKIPFTLDWFPLMYDYTVGLKHNILSHKFIEKAKRDPRLDFKQEFCCRFTSTYTSAIDTSNLKFIPDDVERKIPKDLAVLTGEESDVDY